MLCEGNSHLTVILGVNLLHSFSVIQQQSTDPQVITGLPFNNKSLTGSLITWVSFLYPILGLDFAPVTHLCNRWEFKPVSFRLKQGFNMFNSTWHGPHRLGSLIYVCFQHNVWFWKSMSSFDHTRTPYLTTMGQTRVLWADRHRWETHSGKECRTITAYVHLVLRHLFLFTVGIKCLLVDWFCINRCQKFSLTPMINTKQWNNHAKNVV